jgi:hypothetical protein
VCETWIRPRIQEFIRNIIESGVVPETEVPALSSAIRQVNRMREARLSELVCLLLAFAMPVMEMFIRLPGQSVSSALVMSEAWGTGLPAWYLGFCMPMFRFLMFRWILHLCLWWYFLWRVQRLNLNLIPTHSDSTGGLGYLEVVHEHFMPLVVAISSVVAASFAEDVHSASASYEALPGLAVMLFLVTSLLFVSPLCIFGVKLWRCRLGGLNAYSVMAFRYVQAFDRRWIQEGTASGEAQLGTSDIQSLADLTNSVNVIRNMRVVPVSRKLTMRLATCVILPLLPLLFFKYHGNELATQLFQIVIGN